MGLEMKNRSDIKIGITTDVVDTTIQHRGVSTTVKALVENIAKVNTDYNFNLIHFNENLDDIYQLGLNEIIVKPFSTPSPVLSKTLANIFRAPKLIKNLDVIHFTNPYLFDFPLFFLSRAKKILIVYDTCYFLSDRPELKRLFYKNPKTWAYHKLWKFLLPKIKAKIDLYISISDGTKEDVIKCLNVPSEKIRTVHLGIDDLFKPINIDKLDNSFSQFEPFILTDRPYSSLIKVYHELKKRGIKHKLIGFSGRDYVTKEEIIEFGLENDVHFLGYVSKEDLVKLYNTADLYVRLVYFTGFAIPTVEAMACGCPVVVSNADAAPEVVGDAGILIDPHKLDEWVDKIYEVLTDEKLRDKMSKKGLERAKMFSWKKTAEETLKAYDEILGIDSYDKEN